MLEEDIIWAYYAKKLNTPINNIQMSDSITKNIDLMCIVLVLYMISVSTYDKTKHVIDRGFYAKELSLIYMREIDYNKIEYEYYNNVYFLKLKNEQSFDMAVLLEDINKPDRIIDIYDFDDYREFSKYVYIVKEMKKKSYAIGDCTNKLGEILFTGATKDTVLQIGQRKFQTQLGVNITFDKIKKTINIDTIYPEWIPKKYLYKSQ